jgi:hypothetical protein
MRRVMFESGGFLAVPAGRSGARWAPGSSPGSPRPPVDGEVFHGPARLRGVLAPGAPPQHRARYRDQHGHVVLGGQLSGTESRLELVPRAGRDAAADARTPAGPLPAPPAHRPGRCPPAAARGPPCGPRGTSRSCPSPGGSAAAPAGQRARRAGHGSRPSPDWAMSHETSMRTVRRFARPLFGASGVPVGVLPVTSLGTKRRPVRSEPGCGRGAVGLGSCVGQKS